MRVKNIESFETVTLRESGMRFTSEWEIVCKGDVAEVSEYSIRYNRGSDERIPEARAEIPLPDALKLLNDCGIGSWNGFHGKHPRGVLDGIMFSFRALVNGGERIEADGSQNFPRRYRDFTDALYAILRGGDQ